MMHLYEVAEAANNAACTRPGLHDETFAGGACWAIGWLVALVGMAEAIRTRPRHPCKGGGP